MCLILSRMATVPASTRLLVHVDVDMFGFGFLRLGQSDGEDAVFVLCLHLIGGHRCRQRYRPLEPAKEALGAADFRLLELPLVLAFAREAEGSLVQGHINLLLLHAW